MPLLEEEYRKEEKINGVIYDTSPSPNYQHGIVDGNIYSIIKSGLKGTTFQVLTVTYNHHIWYHIIIILLCMIFIIQILHESQALERWFLYWYTQIYCGNS